ncbi:endo-beta-1,3-glucanase [Rhypophila decipiens]|uniref:glucan endo-1,3-beta-D-glucosidase n=1 Tax=Rhypophila decipiens TaxID=261697 RepID=A0AAN7B4X4_9PEZI|nr:endo-beta-1,3-glucanase [Rhypophila decipiens]
MAQRRYSFDQHVDERQPLENSLPSPREAQPPYQDDYQEGYQPPQQYQQPSLLLQQQQQPPFSPQQQYRPRQNPQSNASSARARPGAHPDSSFDRLRSSRRRSQERPLAGAPGAYAPGSAAANNNHDGPPQPPPHRDVEGRQRDNTYAAQRRPVPQSNITPGADNFSNAAAGGMAGIALTVADQNARESGIEALQGPDYPQQAYQQQRQWPPQGQGQSYPPMVRGPGSNQPSPRGSYRGDNGYNPETNYSSPYSSLHGLNAMPHGPGDATPGQRTPSRSPHSTTNDIYTDDPYQRYSRPQDPRLGVVDPHADIEDDGDEGLEYIRRGGVRTSMLSLGGSSQKSRDTGKGAAVGAGAAGAGGLTALAGRNGSGGSYAPVHNLATSFTGSAGDGNVYTPPDKIGWGAMREKEKKTRKTRMIVIAIVLVLALAGIVLGVLFGVVFKIDDKQGSKQKSGGGSGAVSDHLTLNSDEVQAVMNNPKLHKVFPGIDYTALNTQYPECIHDPPSQDNITLDVAILSQLTNTIRLYGTDCNQTQMVIHAIEVLELKDTVKVWLGVWQDKNATTNKRQLEQMWDILDEYGDEPFKGIIVANEILFREQMTAWELGTLLDSVRTKLKAKNINLPVATSDLGDKWDSTLASKSDYIMGNIHPFFGGTPVEEAAAWTWNFWEQKTQGFAKADKSKNIISETGWPSQGGTHCGGTGTTKCANGATAGIDELNKFMEDWVCPALNNGTEYFWFEAFDEPWKWVFNTDGQEWEDHWGIIDVNRNLKPGIVIPDCGGRTIP